MFEIQIKLPTCVNLLFADLFISKKNDTWTQGQGYKVVTKQPTSSGSAPFRKLLLAKSFNTV